MLQPISEVIVTKRSKQKDNHNQYHQQINTQPSLSDSNHATSSGGHTKPAKCETCARLEAEAKRLKSELNMLKHLESEMREKNEMNSTIKTCLQAKQKEIDEMHNKLVCFIRYLNQIIYLIFFLESKSSQTYDIWIIKTSKL